MEENMKSVDCRYEIFFQSMNRRLREKADSYEIPEEVDLEAETVFGEKATPTETLLYLISKSHQDEVASQPV